MGSYFLFKYTQYINYGFNELNCAYLVLPLQQRSLFSVFFRMESDSDYEDVMTVVDRNGSDLLSPGDEYSPEKDISS